MIKRVLPLIGIFLLIAGSSAVLAMEPDARSFAMGGAYTAVVSDATAVYWNPARLPNIRFFSLALGAGLTSEDLENSQEALEILLDPQKIEEVENLNLQANVSGGFLGAVATRRLGVGLYGNMEVDVEAKTSVDHDTFEGSAESDLVANVRANTVLAYAQPFKRFNLGVALKGVGDGRYTSGEHMEYNAETGKDEESKFNIEKIGTGYSIDLALSTGLTRMIQFGFVAQDVFSSIEYEETVTKDNQGPVTTKLGKQRLEPSYRAGIAIRPGFGFTFAGDVSSTGSVHLGVEKNTLFNALSFRGGMVSKDGATEYRGGVGLNLAWLHAGVGVSYDPEKDMFKAVVLDASLTF